MPLDLNKSFFEYDPLEMLVVSSVFLIERASQIGAQANTGENIGPVFGLQGYQDSLHRFAGRTYHLARMSHPDPSMDDDEEGDGEYHPDDDDGDDSEDRHLQAIANAYGVSDYSRLDIEKKSEFNDFCRDIQKLAAGEITGERGLAISWGVNPDPAQYNMWLAFRKSQSLIFADPRDPYYGYFFNPHSHLMPYGIAWKDKPKLMVSIYANLGHLLAGRRTTMKLGTFLSKYGLSSTMIEVIVNTVKESTINPEELKFAVTGEEIANVYASGPGSCMSTGKLLNIIGDSFNVQSRDRPQYIATKAYCYPADRVSVDAPDSNGIAVAYLTGDYGRINGRAVVNVKRKLYCRVYGQETVMNAALRKAGYRQTSSLTNGDPLRLALKLLPGERDAAFPYLDSNEYNGIVVKPPDRDGYIAVCSNPSEGNWGAHVPEEDLEYVLGTISQAASGICRIHSVEECEICGNRVDSQRIIRNVFVNERETLNCCDNHRINTAYVDIPINDSDGNPSANMGDWNMGNILGDASANIDGHYIGNWLLNRLPRCPDCGTAHTPDGMYTPDWDGDTTRRCRRCHRAAYHAQVYVEAFYLTPDGRMESARYHRNEVVNVTGLPHPVFRFCLTDFATRTEGYPAVWTAIGYEER